MCQLRRQFINIVSDRPLATKRNETTPDPSQATNANESEEDLIVYTFGTVALHLYIQKTTIYVSKKQIAIG